jgi:hypothetical protein
MVARKQIVPQLTRMCQEIWHDQGELWKQCWSVQQGTYKKKHSILLLGWVYHVVVCLRVARLLCCYLLADNSFPKKWLFLEGICHTKRKTESGKGSNVGSCWPDLASKRWNTGHLSKECCMRMTTLACSTGQAKGSRDWKKWIGWQLSGQTQQLNVQSSGAGWTKWDSPNPILTFPNYSSTTHMHIDGQLQLGILNLHFCGTK